MAKILDVSSITEQIRARIAQLEEQLKQQRNLNDELDRLRGALARLEGEVRSRVTGKSRRRSTPSATAQPEAPASRSGSAAPKRTATSTRAQTGKKSAARGTTAKSGRATTRAPRGQNRTKILEALTDGPMTASEISLRTGIGRAIASTMLSKLAKEGTLVKAQRGYALPK